MRIGDQVLRLVAARLAQATGGGTVYRYGGEEFCILFPGASLVEALPHIEKLRADIAACQMAVLAEDRPKDLGSRHPAAGAREDAVYNGEHWNRRARRRACHAGRGAARR